MTKFKIPLITPFFAIALTACTIARYLQYTTVVEIESGFFAFDGGMLNHIYYIFFAIAAAGFIALSLIDKKAGRGIQSNIRKAKKGEKTVRAIRKTPPPLSTVYAIIGAGISAFCGFLLATQAVTDFQKGVHFIPLAAVILAALGFTFAGYVIFTHKKITPIASLAFLVIAANYICSGSIIFMQRVYTKSMSAVLIELSVLLLLSVFFLACGRIAVQSETRFTASIAAVCGYSLVLLAISDAVSRILYYYSIDASTQHALLRHNDNGFTVPTPLFIAQAVMVLWLIFALSARNQTAALANQGGSAAADEGGLGVHPHSDEETDNNSTSAD